MKKYSLYTLVFVTFAILTATSLGLVYYFANQHRNDLMNTAQEEKINLVKMIDDVLNSPRYLYEMAKSPGLEKLLVVEMATFHDVRFLRMVTDTGSIYNSNLDEDWNQTLNDPLIIQASDTRTIITKDEIFHDEPIKEIIYPALGGKLLVIGYSLASVEKNVRLMFIRDIIAVLGGLFLTYVVIFMILRWGIIKPLKQVISVCQMIKQGNLDTSINIKSMTEIGELAATFNGMVANLKQSRQALEKSKANLEVKVAERTSELKKLTESLDEQVKKKTAELYQKMEELERFNKLSVGRELRMMDLKKEITRLRRDLLDKPT